MLDRAPTPLAGRQLPASGDRVNGSPRSRSRCCGLTQVALGLLSSLGSLALLLPAATQADDAATGRTTTEPATAGPPHAAHPLAGLRPGHWYEVPDSRLEALDPCPGNDCPYSGSTGQRSVMQSWNGGAYDTSRNRLLVWGGGHGNYAGNEVYAFDVAEGRWLRLSEPSTDVGGDPASPFYPDGQPRARHTYYTLEYLPQQDRLLAVGAPFFYPRVASARVVQSFDLKAGRWDPAFFAPDPPAPNGSTGGTPVYDPGSGDVWYLGDGGSAVLSRLDPDTREWTAYRGVSGGPNRIYAAAAIDPERRLLIRAGAAGDGRQLRVWDLERPRKAARQPRTCGDDTLESRGGFGFAFHPPSGQFVGWDGGADVYALNPDTWRWRRIEPAPDNPVTPGPAGRNGTFGRFRYMPDYDAFIVVSATDENVFYYRLDGTAPGARGAAATDPCDEDESG